MIYNLEYDSQYDVYRYDGKLFICAKALRRMFPRIGNQMELALCDEKPGIRIMITSKCVVVGFWFWRREYTVLYPKLINEMTFLQRPEPYFVRML